MYVCRERERERERERDHMLMASSQVLGTTYVLTLWIFEGLTQA